jgi:predicted secreted protein
VSIVSGIIVFIIIWWVVLFGVLPLGVRVPDNPGQGHASSAPERPQLLRKALITTAITIVIWLAVFALIESDLISFRRMAG